MTTLDQAYEMGAKGAEPTEAESLLFEAWMRGHCWMVHGDWDGKTYVHATERNGEVNYHTMHTRQLWAAWRDRAALAEQPAQPQQEPVAWLELLREARDNCKASIVEEGISASRKEYRIDLEARLTAALNTSPPAQRTWVGLTDEQAEDAARYEFLVKLFGVTKLPCLLERALGKGYIADGKASIDAAIDAAIEAKLKEKNT